MKKSFLFRIFLAVPVFLMFSCFTFTADFSKVVGSWKVSVPDAPPEYASSTMVVTESDGALKVKLIFGESYATEGYEATFDGETLKFSVGVEGSQIPLTGKINGNTIKGVVTTPDGEIGLTAEKITLTGSWSYKVPDAPDEYSSGRMVFSLNEGKAEGKIVMPGGMEIPLTDLSATETTFTFSMSLEGSTINVSGGIADGKLVGKSVTPQGDMSFTAKKE
jgi:hypothetical protein